MTLATYHTPYGKVEVVAAYNKDDTIDFYDLYYNGVCINLGDPIYVWPTYDEAVETLRTYTQGDF